MDKKSELVIIDTNIFVIDLRYKRDSNFKINQRFLKKIVENGKGFTTIINLLELCGILSFNLNSNQLNNLWHFFQERYNVTIMPPPDLNADILNIKTQYLFDKICNKISFGDALFLSVAEKYLPFVKCIATWDKEHFKNKYSGSILTPGDYIKK